MLLVADIKPLQAFRESYREERGYTWVAPEAERIIKDGLKMALVK